MDVTEIIEYYRNLLIIQYHEKPKAVATIELFCRELLASGIIFDVRDAYNLDTATGVQLDVIGKYVGVDRFYTVSDVEDYFALASYDEVSPGSAAKYGFSTYSTYGGASYNGTITYNSILNQGNNLSDDDFRILIRLKILQNNINHSHKSIDDALWEAFGADVVASSTGAMDITYTISSTVGPIFTAALQKKVLPRPMGVELNLVIV